MLTKISGGKKSSPDDPPAEDLDEVRELLSWESQVIIYRIFQEAFTNIAKHAEATRVGVSVKKKAGAVAFQVEDNGRGFDLPRVVEMNNANRGLGLAAMDERVRMLRETMKIRSHPGDGTRLVSSVPFQ